MLKDITTAQKTSSESASSSTYGAENTLVTDAQIKKGFIAETMKLPADQEGNTREGNPYEREGFLSPVLSNSR